MPSPEIPLSLTPRQAADGAIVTAHLPTGATRIRIPPAQDGDLVRARAGGRDVLLRIRVTGAGTSKGRPWPALLGIAAVIGAVVLLAVIGAEDDNTSAIPSARPSAYEPHTEDPYEEDAYPGEIEDTYSEAPDAEGADTGDTPDAGDTPETEDTYTEDPYDTASEAPDPYETGTCLNGTLPDSTTAQEVSGVDEVSCSAPDAHYRVIETIPSTSDMSRCDANSSTQYAFSYRYTLNGATLNEYVYCLVGLGSYAR
ncbi:MULTISPECIES: LppU/SCO3897 family protein [Streptomyces]|uniref:Serine/threonine protein kinase n=1 Tax=Streptomyces mutomycini TaxID=284036 RepID=A0ABW0B519_9ACTN|nr:MULTISPECIES: hypothetical protein [Streptomyces]KPC82355.1 hypothetical protein ADK82_13745 [Streptomyces sp. NRRL S-4]